MRTLESARRDHKLCIKIIKDNGSPEAAVRWIKSNIAHHPNNIEGNRAWCDRIERIHSLITHKQ